MKIMMDFKIFQKRKTLFDISIGFFKKCIVSMLRKHFFQLVKLTNFPAYKSYHVNEIVFRKYVNNKRLLSKFPHEFLQNV